MTRPSGYVAKNHHAAILGSYRLLIERQFCINTVVMDDVIKKQAPEVWLAPMSGATDAPFRRQAVHFGTDLVVSEMTASEQLVLSRPDVIRRACRHDGGGAWIVQLAGRDPAHMRAGAALLAKAGVDMIDINMGCPSRKVTGGLSGSALMREPELAGAIIDATIEGAGDVPVSLKMRLGWDDTLLNAPDMAQMAQSAGIVRLTVHGRTRCQFYKGQADWRRIRETVEAVTIPVVANGDISSLKDAEEALEQSGACGVMVGRAAMGTPWLPAEIAAGLQGQAYQPPSLKARFSSLREQIEDACDLYSERLGVRICRKHVSASLADAPLDITPERRRMLQSELCQIDTADALISNLAKLYNPTHKKSAA